MTISTDDIKAVIDTPPGVDLSTFLATANAVWNSMLQSKGIVSALQDPIILYLAAHFAAITIESGGLRRQRLGESDESYKAPSDRDVGLASTRYGQQAMLLDTSGTLANISANNGLKAQFGVIMNSHYIKPIEIWKYQ